MEADWLERVRTEPLLAVLVWTAVVLVALALVTLTWLFARAVWDARRRRRQERFWGDLGIGLVAALDEPGGETDWIAMARRYPSETVRDCLNEHLVRTAGDYREALARIYRRLGYLDTDLAALRSGRWSVRMRALRRMATIVSTEHRAAVVELAAEGGEIRLLVAQILGRIGTAEDVLALLRSWRVSSRLSEYPVNVMIEGMTPEALRVVVGHWHELGHSPAVQRILLAAAAKAVPGACSELLPDAARHPSIEIRIAAARACGAIARDETFEILRRLAEDDAWEVRAQAVKALGSHRGPASQALLVATMSDKSFWVRQNAASALGLHGAEGIRRLREVKARSSDGFARDAADHVLTHLTLGLETA